MRSTVRVAGLVTTGLQELDARLLKTHLVTGERLLGTDRVSSIVIGLDDTARTQEVGDALALRLRSASSEPLVLTDWRARAPFYGQVRALYSGVFWFLGGIVFVLVCLATSNTLLMSVMERVREFGTLLAIGTGRGQVALMVVLEALWLGVVGSARRRRAGRRARHRHQRRRHRDAAASRAASRGFPLAARRPPRRFRGQSWA